MMQVCEPLYSANRHPKTKVTVDQGGTSSAKTYTVLQVQADIAVHERNKVITIVGQDIPNLKKGAMRDWENILLSSPFLQSQIKKHNASDRTYYFKSGTVVEFTSYGDEQDAKSGKRDYLFINECNGVPYMVYWQLAFRTRKHVWLDYNPNAKFWVHEHLINEPGVTLLISDHRHNRFLSR
jgi:phage terminase large subunit